jgi:uncharacterized protein (TIGR02217 family)
MGAFLEERLPIDITYNSSFGETYNVEITETAGGSEYRRLNNPRPRMIHDISYALRDRLHLLNGVLDLYHRCYGRYAGFRVRNLAYYSTNGHTLTPTALDQDLTLISAGVYQLVMRYGDPGKPVLADIGRPIRNLYKPVSGTVRVGIGSVAQTLGWTVGPRTAAITDEIVGAPEWRACGEDAAACEAAMAQVMESVAASHAEAARGLERQRERGLEAGGVQELRLRLDQQHRAGGVEELSAERCASDDGHGSGLLPARVGAGSRGVGHGLGAEPLRASAIAARFATR